MLLYAGGFRVSWLVTLKEISDTVRVRVSMEGLEGFLVCVISMLGAIVLVLKNDE